MNLCWLAINLEIRDLLFSYVISLKFHFQFKTINIK